MEFNKIEDQIQKLKEYLVDSTIIQKYNKRISNLLVLYAFQQAENKNYENDLINIAEEFKIDKPNLKVNLQLYVSFEEFSKFTKKLFFATWEEYKSKKITYETASVFRLISNLIDLMSIWRIIKIDEKWIKRSKINCINL